ncbi:MULTISPECIES: class I SAM-dependent methyltransferase [Arthrobacter]|uniref:Class I SAM-dependent methyltransferase n=2 Tax=Arthrobacter TaxID=1663 RepID=A0ABU9KL31_9MICC|nr:class I SAM-dependent methyltransferase [Arthrobacter sp. YJM1]MDP5227275.1 class I SAM-dependent methyltransferase [Arthrobacter sp. YJM1]
MPAPHVSPVGGPRMTTARRREMGRAFETGGEHYEQVRPSYPAEAARWAVPNGARDAVDLGAGTGKFTGLLTELGLAVTAVEPSEDMLAQLHVALPGVTTVLGTGEASGLPTASADVATVAQAWHWFDPAAASAEAARILRPGGRLVLLWNQLDTSVPWVHRLTRIMHAGDVIKPHYAPSIGPEFLPPEAAVLPWHDELTTLEVMELTKSRSYYLRSSEAVRAKVLANLDWYLHEHLGHAVGERLTLPYRCYAWRAVRA